MDVLIVIDMQNDFISGALGTAEAEKIVPLVAEKIRSFKGRVLFTQDTHGEDYDRTQEGRLLPVAHCIKNEEGWRLHPEIAVFANKRNTIEKPVFGTLRISSRLKRWAQKETIDSITCIGLCTDVCVISNAAILKAAFPEAELIVDASCCAGVTPQGHITALNAMKPMQIKIVNE